jgi:predicted regulator of Ras-like GTPase activity (Roadblock/LC7/MglB family)
MAAGEEAVLTVLARREAKLGLILYDMKKAAADISAMI